MGKFGCKKSPPDNRDFKIMALRAVAPPPIELPPKIDYTEGMTSVKNQYDEGTCVGFASTAMKEWQEKKEHKYAYDFSERYIYERAREIDGSTDDEEGTTIRAAMEVLYKKGVCEETCWPYAPHLPGTPCKKCEKLAEPFQTKMYVGLDTIDHMKEALVTNGPFVIGIDVFDSFDNGKHGKIPMPEKDEKSSEGHAICIIGYNDETGYFKFKNSWGWTWGDGGYGYLPYDYVSEYSYDGWTASDKSEPMPNRTWWERFVDWCGWLKSLFSKKS